MISIVPLWPFHLCVATFFSAVPAYGIYICKTQIGVQSLIDVQSSNPCPIYMSQTSVPHIYVLFSNRRPITSLTYALTDTLIGEVFKGMMEKFLKSYCVYSGPVDCKI
jgi:hypothetical protein